MMSSVEEKTWIILEADDLPDMGLSGNRRRGNFWAELAKKETAESEKWFMLFHNQVLAAQSDPRMAPMPWKKASINVELTFKEERRRDLDNLMIAMKPLHDTLHVGKKLRQGRGAYVFGLNILQDDSTSNIPLYSLSVTVDKGTAPHTRIEIVKEDDDDAT